MIHTQLSSPDKLVSLGEYLQLIREKLELSQKDFASRFEIDPSVIHGLETNAIGIVSIPVEKLYFLGNQLELNNSIFIALLRKSHHLYKLKPKYKGAARYNTKSNASAFGKGQAMKSAFEELLQKGKPEQSDDGLESHLQNLQNMLGQG